MVCVYTSAKEVLFSVRSLVLYTRLSVISQNIQVRFSWNLAEMFRITTAKKYYLVRRQGQSSKVKNEIRSNSREKWERDSSKTTTPISTKLRTNVYKAYKWVMVKHLDVDGRHIENLQMLIARPRLRYLHKICPRTDIGPSEVLLT